MEVLCQNAIGKTQRQVHVAHLSKGLLQSNCSLLVLPWITEMHQTFPLHMQSIYALLFLSLCMYRLKPVQKYRTSVNSLKACFDSLKALILISVRASPTFLCFQGSLLISAALRGKKSMNELLIIYTNTEIKFKLELEHLQHWRKYQERTFTLLEFNHLDKLYSVGWLSIFSWVYLFHRMA